MNERSECWLPLTPDDYTHLVKCGHSKNTKGRILHDERPSFTTQKAVFRIAKHGLLVTVWQSVSCKRMKRRKPFSPSHPLTFSPFHL